MQPHIASYSLSTMEQRADVSGKAYVHVATHEDGEPVHLTVELAGPAKYHYFLSYCGLQYGVSPRIAITEQIERRSALAELKDTDADRLDATSSVLFRLVKEEGR